MKKKRKRRYSLTEGRTYVHSKCGKSTVINEEDFIGICNPFHIGMGTLCSHCGRPDSLKRFTWLDTGECVADYRKRLRRESPLAYRLWAWLIAPLVGTVLGVVVSMFIFPKGPEYNVIGAIVGAFAMFKFIAPAVIQMIADNRFYNTR